MHFCSKAAAKSLTVVLYLLSQLRTDEIIRGHNLSRFGTYEIFYGHKLSRDRGHERKNIFILHHVIFVLLLTIILLKDKEKEK